VDGATFMRAELLAGSRDEKGGIGWSRCPVSSLIEARIVNWRSANVTRFANANGRANGIDKVLIYAVIANPGRQISWRCCGATDKGWRNKRWRDIGRRLVLRSGHLRGKQERQTREQAQHVFPLGWLRVTGSKEPRNVT
jgi:hypothetical protein